MRTLIKTMKIGLAVTLFSLLMWFPGKISDCENRWGPTPCYGQEYGGLDASPENLGAGSYGGNEFIGQVNLLHNVVRDSNAFYSVHLLSAFQGFTGIAQINQAAGMFNNQVTYIGLAGLRDGAPTSGLRMSYASLVSHNSLTISNNTYQTRIKGPSFAGGSGIALVNQVSGHLNAMLTGVFLAMGTNGANDLTDLQLRAISSHNTLTFDPEAPSLRVAELELDKGAFRNYTGIWGTSQIAGNLNQVTTVFNIRVTTVP